MAINEFKRRQTAVIASTAATSGGILLKKLAPDAPGTKRLATRYGSTLVCVRYREDAARGRRLTTIELVVEERPLPPPVAVRVAFEEADLRSKVKAASGDPGTQAKIVAATPGGRTTAEIEQSGRFRKGLDMDKPAYPYISSFLHMRTVMSIFGSVVVTST